MSHLQAMAEAVRAAEKRSAEELKALKAPAPEAEELQGERWARDAQNNRMNQDATVYLES